MDQSQFKNENYNYRNKFPGDEEEGQRPQLATLEDSQTEHKQQNRMHKSKSPLMAFFSIQITFNKHIELSLGDKLRKLSPFHF